MLADPENLANTSTDRKCPFTAGRRFPGSCPLWWCKSAGLFLISGWLGRFCQATAGSLTNGSWLNGAMVSRVM